MLRATTVSHDRSEAASARLVLTHDERHLRRKVLMLDGGERVLVDLAQATALCDGDRLVLDDGRLVEVIAAQEALLEVRGETPRALTVLAWHIGNRHLPAQVEADRILIGRDHVIADMLAGLGAGVREVVEPFTPERGAYSEHSHAGSHAHGHDHGGGHAHGHAHGHAEGHTHSHDHDEAHEAGGADPMSGITGRAVKDHA